MDRGRVCCGSVCVVAVSELWQRAGGGSVWIVAGVTRGRVWVAVGGKRLSIAYQSFGFKLTPCSNFNFVQVRIGSEATTHMNIHLLLICNLIR